MKRIRIIKIQACNVIFSSFFYKSNLENPSAIKISPVGPHIKRSEEHAISIIYTQYGAQ